MDGGVLALFESPFARRQVDAQTFPRSWCKSPAEFWNITVTPGNAGPGVSSLHRILVLGIYSYAPQLFLSRNQEVTDVLCF